MFLHPYLFFLAALLVSGALSYLLTRTSERLGYAYGSPFRNRLSVYLSIGYSGVLAGFALEYLNRFSLRGSAYFLLYVAAATLAIASSFVDIRYREIPDEYNLAGLFLGGLSILLIPQRVNQAILVGALMFVIYFLIMAITRAMGGGDVKMAGALGTLVPFRYFGTFLLAPFALGTAAAGYLILIKKKDKHSLVAFGPYITGGFLLITFLYWSGWVL